MSDDERKHLDMIQTVVSRMASNSFLLKGWSVASAGALLSVAVGTKRPIIGILAALPVIAFWLMDGYYLALERRYRALFNAAAGLPATHGAPPAGKPALYSMDVTGYTSDNSALSGARAASVAGLHGSILCAIVVATWIVQSNASQPVRPTPIRVQDTVRVRVLPSLP